MKVVITGATGFIGRHLTARLIDEGHTVVGLSRNPEKSSARMPPSATLATWPADSNDTSTIEDCDAIVNLAGENLSAGRWTPRRREALLQSRLGAIRAIAGVLTGRKRQVTLIQASAVGFYGPRDSAGLREHDAPGSGYLAHIAKSCEEEAQKLSGPNVRVVSIRTGIVLGREAGILPLLMRPLRLGAGGYPGSGNQGLSWIHIHDEVEAILHLLMHPELEGAFNLTAPEPVSMREFVRLAGSILHRPVWVPLPPFLLRIVFGEMADEALLTGQRVLPARLEASGFRFEYPTVGQALENLLT